MTGSGLCALHRAVQQGDIRSVEELLARGSNINVQTMAKRRPLHFAARKGNLALVRLLLDRGADIDAENVETYKFCFSIAIPCQVSLVD
jgi:ankyrin repeat protein